MTNIKNMIFVDPLELSKKIGTHKYELILFTTTWCAPCQALKENSLANLSIKDIDYQIYAIDGDLCDEYDNLSIMLSAIKELIDSKQISSKKEFLTTIVKKKIDKKKHAKILLNYLIEFEILKEENNLLITTKKCENILMIKNPMHTYNIEGFPTIIFYKNGKLVKDFDEKNLTQNGCLVGYNAENFDIIISQYFV